jgi:hypothetical protein
MPKEILTADSADYTDYSEEERDRSEWRQIDLGFVAFKMGRLRGGRKEQIGSILSGTEWPIIPEGVGLTGWRLCAADLCRKSAARIYALPPSTFIRAGDPGWLTDLIRSYRLTGRGNVTDHRRRFCEQCRLARSGDAW